MPPLDAATADRLAKLCGMLGSDHDGERASAAAKADRLVRDAGLTWPEIICPQPAPRWLPVDSPRDLARQCSRYPAVLNEWNKNSWPGSYRA